MNKYGKKLIKLLFLTFIFILPLFFSRFTETVYEFPKIYLLKNITGFILFLSIFFVKKWIIPRDKIFYLLCFFIIIGFVSIFYSYSPILAQNRFIILLSAILISFIGFQFSSELFSKLKVLLLLSIHIVALYAIFQLFYAKFHSFNAFEMGIKATLGDWRDFITSTLGNTDFIAGLLCLFFPFIIIKCFTATSKIYIISFFIFSTALFICWSVSADSSIIYFLCVYFFIYQRKLSLLIRKKIKILVTLIFLSICIVLFFNLPNKINPLSPGIFKRAFSSKRWHLGGPTRYIIWEKALNIFKKHPLIGCGLNNFIYLFPAENSSYIEKYSIYKHYAGQFTNATHNDVFQVLCELGILGGLLFIWLILGSIIRSYKYSHLFTLTFFSMFLFNSQMSFPFQLTVQMSLFFIFLFFILNKKYYQIKLSAFTKAGFVLFSLFLLVNSDKELISHNLYKKVRDMNYFISFKYNLSFGKIQKIYEKKWLTMKMKNYEKKAREMINNYPHIKNQVKLLKKIYYFTPYYYDALSKYAQYEFLSGNYEKSYMLYSQLLLMLNTREIIWNYIFSCLELGKYEEAHNMLLYYSNRQLLPYEKYMIKNILSFLRKNYENNKKNKN